MAWQGESCTPQHGEAPAHISWKREESRPKLLTAVQHIHPEHNHIHPSPADNTMGFPCGSHSDRDHAFPVKFTQLENSNQGLWVLVRQWSLTWCHGLTCPRVCFRKGGLTPEKISPIPLCPTAQHCWYQWCICTKEGLPPSFPAHKEPPPSHSRPCCKAFLSPLSFLGSPPPALLPGWCWSSEVWRRCWVHVKIYGFATPLGRERLSVLNCFEMPLSPSQFKVTCKSQHLLPASKTDNRAAHVYKRHT